MSLFKATAIVSIFTFISRISGFIRDMVVAWLWGTSIWGSAFFVVFQIPNFMRRLFAEGSFSLAFVPVLNEIKATGSKADLKHFIDRVSGTLMTIVIIVWIVMEIFAPQVLTLFAYTWTEDKPEVFDEAVWMLRFTLFYLPLITLVAFAGGILNAHKKFALPAATPILLNLSLIGCAIFLKDSFDISVKSLAVGVLVAGVLQLMVQIPSLYRLGLIPKFIPDFKDSKIKKVMKLMVPTLFASSVAQVNLLLDTLIATMLPIVGVSFLYFSNRLLEFPLGVFVIAISTVILPTLSRQFAKSEDEKFLNTMKWALNLGFFIAIPAAVGLLVLAKEVVVTLYQYGEFNAESTEFTSLSLIAFMLALPAFVLNKILLPAYYSRKDTKTPVKIGLISMFSNMGLNILFVWLMWYLGFIALHVGLALASAVSGWLQTILLYRSLKKNGIVSNGVIDWIFVVKISVSAIVMAGVLVFIVSNLSEWQVYSASWRAFYLLMCISIGFAIYLLCLKAQRVNFKNLLVHQS